jgi:WD40 repeat protein
VIYDAAARTQQLLQGHKNPITATCVSADKRIIVTADSGADALLAVWDATTGLPLKTFFNPGPGGVVAVRPRSKDVLPK